MKNWRAALAAQHAAKPGCFQAVYPSTTLQEVSCGTASPKAVSTVPVKTVLHPLDEKSTGDYSLHSQSVIYQATGSLLAVENVTSVYGFGSTAPNGPVANEFSLQLNTDRTFPRTGPGSICQPSKNPNCKGWMQFIYDSGGSIFIQVWALGYNLTSGPCPAGLPKNDTSGLNCGVNIAIQPLPPSLGLKVPDLAGALLIGKVYKSSAGVVYDELQFTVAGTYYVINAADSSGAYGNWTNAEFNLVGNSGSDQTVFNSGSLISVALDLDNDFTTGTVTCNGPGAGTTGETTNLTLGACTVANGKGIRFKEGVVPIISAVSPASGSSAGGAAVTIQAAVTNPNNTPVVNGFNTNPIVRFGANPAVVQSCSPVQCIVTSPPASGAQTVDITAANVFKDGTPGPFSSPAAADRYAYYAQIQCQLSGPGCPAGNGGGPVQYQVSCPVPVNFAVNGQIKELGTSFAGQEIPYVNNVVSACVPNTANCQQFSLPAAQLCPAPPPVPIKQKNCLVCTQNGQQCVKEDGGFVCKGTPR